MAAHASTRATQLDGRRTDRVTLDEVPTHIAGFSVSMRGSFPIAWYYRPRLASCARQDYIPQLMRVLKKMPRYAWSSILLIVPFVLVGAHAQTTVDVTKITCDQFLRLSVASPDTIAIWLNGYYHGAQHKAVVDVQQLKSQSQDMMSYCLYKGKGGTMPVMEAAEQVLTQSK
jgi:hypothetical protein